jgi:dihydroorotate dehydrogenase electron transfer subunit
MGKKYTMAEIVSQKSLAEGIFDMTLKAPEVAAEAKAGQFLSVYVKDQSKILPRPISICGISREEGLFVWYIVLQEKEPDSCLLISQEKQVRS